MARRSAPRSMPTDPSLWQSGAGGRGVRQIVVGVDGSPPSLNAVGTAAQIAQVTGARLTVVHVKPRAAAVGLLMPGWGCMLEQWREDLELEVGMDVATILDPIGVTWELSICSGDPACRLDEIATELDADLVVVGTHGGGMLRCLLRGSVAGRLLRRERRPLLVVH
jgi:nucleotide-binding universal stress UspA family protein